MPFYEMECEVVLAYRKKFHIKANCEQSAYVMGNYLMDIMAEEIMMPCDVCDLDVVDGSIDLNPIEPKNVDKDIYVEADFEEGADT